MAYLTFYLISLQAVKQVNNAKIFCDIFVFLKISRVKLIWIIENYISLERAWKILHFVQLKYQVSNYSFWNTFELILCTLIFQKLWLLTWCFYRAKGRIFHAHSNDIKFLIIQNILIPVIFKKLETSQKVFTFFPCLSALSRVKYKSKYVIR